VARRYRLSVRPTHRPVVLYYRHKPKIRASTTTYVRQPPAPPHGVSNEGNYAHLYSGNIMYDPGLELYVGNAVGSYRVSDWFRGWWNRMDISRMRSWWTTIGSTTFTLPRFDATAPIGQRWPNSIPVDYYDIAQWGQLGGTYTPATGTVDDAAWRVGMFDPYAGRYHLYWNRFQADTSYGVPAPLYVQAPGLPGGYSARVIPSDLVTWEASVRITAPWKTWGTVVTGFVLTFYTKSGTAILSTTTTWTSTANAPYQIRSLASFCPPNSYFVRASMYWRLDSPGQDHILCVDGGILAVE
jgi:hypothetical protein